MAIFKASIMAFALSFALPVVGGLFQPQLLTAVQTTGFIRGPTSGSVIYKTEMGFPDFMIKKSFPATYNRTLPKPYMAVSNQIIAAL